MYFCVLLSQYKSLLVCQYKLLVSGMCAELKSYANATLHTLYAKLDVVCDIKGPFITDKPSTRKPISDCEEEKAHIDRCYQEKLELEGNNVDAPLCR